MILEVNSVAVSFGANEVLRDVSFQVHEKERVALVGYNGCGKTTLLSVVTGELAASSGSVTGPVAEVQPASRPKAPRPPSLSAFRRPIERDSDGRECDTFINLAAIESILVHLSRKMKSSSSCSWVHSRGIER